MALKGGYSSKSVDENVATLLREGHTKAQALAIALNVARREYFKRYPHRALPGWLTPKDGMRVQRKRNPVPPSSSLTDAGKKMVNAAARLFEDFTGHDAEHVATVDKPEMPDVLLAVGEIDAICYTTVRDGETEKYIHEFKKKCRPQFCVTPDGKQIVLLGGEYTFTDRGIVDGRD